MIRIHPLLDRAFVPTWFLEYVVFHEMLHAMVPDRYDEQGRRLVHHDGFVGARAAVPLVPPGQSLGAGKPRAVLCAEGGFREPAALSFAAGVCYRPSLPVDHAFHLPARATARVSSSA